MLKYFLLSFFLFYFQIAFNQNNTILEFDKTTHNFGQIKESLGSVKTVFKFKNISKKPICIERIYAGCGCTTTKYTMDTVFPGKSGVVEAVYSTINSIGSFNKYLIVFINDTSNKGIYLYLTGQVFRGEKIIEEKYTQSIGKLKFKSNHVAFNILKNKEIKTDTLWFYNSSKNKLKIEFSNVPHWIDINPKKINIKSTFEKFILVTYDASKRNDWGLNFDKFTMKTSDDTLANKDIYVSAQIEEDFSNFSDEQLNNAPIAYFKIMEYDFGEVKEGTSIFYRFELRNEGKSDLIVRKTTTSCGCTISNVDKTTLKPGENCFVSVSFNTGGRVGEQHKTITILTNDPKRSNITLSLTGTIK
jgi:hypothetical protein